MKTLPNCGILHAGNPKTVKRLCTLALMIDEPENQLSFPPGIRCTDKPVNIRAVHQLLQDGIQTLQEDGTLDDLIDTYITNVSTSGAAGGSQADNEKTYVVGVTGDLPPLDYVAADGVPAGFNVALMNAISDKMDAVFTFVQVEADARLSALSSGKIDVIFWYGNVQGYTSERDELLITDEYYEDNVYYVTKSFDMNRILEAMKAQ